jgi:O-antigen ligase
VLVALILTLAAVLVPQGREVTYEGLRDIGARRLAQPLSSDADWSELLGARPARWRQALETIERRPLWGAGPHSIQEMPVTPAEDLEPGEAPAISPDNTHNYFLQFAAEYGVPAAIALLALLAATLSWTVRGALHHPSPRSRSLLAGIASGQIGFLIFAIVSHPMLLAECQALFWTLSGIAIATVESAGNHANGGDSLRPGREIVVPPGS